jgi:hypothetical protein
MFMRKIGKLLRGNATPFQILSAAKLGALLGSLPGFGQGPLLLVLLLFLLVVLNANLFVAGIVLLLVKLLTLLLLPLYFDIGVYLLEGPLAGLAAALVNAPVTAWFGFDYYVMLPSLFFGGLFGALAGFGLIRALGGFRRRMAELESGSEKYQAYTSKFWVKALAWIFVGGLKCKKDWSELGGKRTGMPVRPIGIVLVAALVVLGYVGLQLLDQTIVTSMTRDALERINGATVDIAAVDIQARENRLVVTGLAMADPEDLQNNRFASREIIADISGMSLLAKKVVIDSLQIREPQTGTARRVAGRRTVPAPPVEAEPGEAPGIDDYVKQAAVWRERLATLKRLYERLAPYLDKDDEAVEEDPAAPGWRERLEQRAREAGYAAVRAESLIRGSPTLWIRELQADNLVVGGSGEVFEIEASNLSTHPALVEQSGRIHVRRADGQLEVELGLPSSEAPARSALNVRYSGLAVSELEERIGRDLPMEGGSMDIVGAGTIDSGRLNLPLTVTLRNTTLNAFGASLAVDDFPLQARIHGPLEQPMIDIPKEALEEAVKSGGRKKIEGLIQEKAGDKLRGILPFGGG